MGLIAPLFLGALALLALPWLFHRIRRPDRDVVPFSSLMFVPQVKKEVVERRRLQHLLLMLLRMALLALLVLAFSRPYRIVRELEIAHTNAPEIHLLLLDTSASMNAGNTFEQARDQARQILARIPEQARVGLMTFDAGARMHTALDSQPASSHAATRAALDQVQVSQRDTRYLAALQTAEHQLLAQLGPAEREKACVLHLITDFRRNGLPQDLPNWRLSGRIHLEAYAVGEDRFDNAAVADVIVREDQDGKGRVLARLRNYGARAIELEASLLLAAGSTQLKRVSIGPGNTTLVSFDPIPLGERLEGEVRLPADGFSGDDRRQWLWQASAGQRIWLVGDALSQGPYGDLFFLQHALTAAGPRAWAPIRMEPAALAQRLAAEPAPAAIVLGECSQLGAPFCDAVNAYVKAGGALLVCLGERLPTNEANRLLRNFGLETRGLAYPKPAPAQAAGLSWIDFEQAAFSAFKSARFNDFSSLRFNNWHPLELSERAVPLAKLGRADGSLATLMAEASAGRGRVLVWGFSPRLSWTNLPKHPKWVPLLQEQLFALLSAPQAAWDFTIGQEFPLERLESESGDFLLRWPDGRETRYQGRAELRPMPLTSAGLVAFRERDSQAWRTIAAVNPRVGEGDPERILEREFALKFTTKEHRPQSAAEQALTVQYERQRRGEWGWWLAGLALVLLIAETLYALRVAGSKAASRRGHAGTV